MATLGSGNVQIDTYGELKTLIKAVTTRQKGLKIKGVIIDTIVDELVGKLPGGPTAKKTLDFVKAAFGKPDTVKTNTWLDKLDVDDQFSAIVDDTIENSFLQDISKRIEGQPENTPLRQDFNMNTELIDYLKRKYRGRSVAGPQNENRKMKKSQLREIILEELKGYTKNPRTGEIETTQGGTSADFRNILTRLAKGDSEEEKAKRGHAVLDKANQEKVAQILRGEIPKYGEDETVSEGTSALSLSQIKSKLEALAKDKPKTIVKFSYVGGNGNRATASNSAENWVKKLSDFTQGPFTEKGDNAYETADRLYKSDKSTQPKDSTVRGLGSLD
jgi:hypothetical protein